jgi:hypothetical protein
VSDVSLDKIDIAGLEIVRSGEMTELGNFPLDDLFALDNFGIGENSGDGYVVINEFALAGGTREEFNQLVNKANFLIAEDKARVEFGKSERDNIRELAHESRQDLCDELYMSLDSRATDTVDSSFLYFCRGKEFETALSRVVELKPDSCDYNGFRNDNNNLKDSISATHLLSPGKRLSQLLQISAHLCAPQVYSFAESAMNMLTERGSLALISTAMYRRPKGFEVTIEGAHSKYPWLDALKKHFPNKVPTEKIENMCISDVYNCRKYADPETYTSFIDRIFAGEGNLVEFIKYCEEYYILDMNVYWNPNLTGRFLTHPISKEEIAAAAKRKLAKLQANPPVAPNYNIGWAQIKLHEILDRNSDQ